MKISLNVMSFVVEVPKLTNLTIFLSFSLCSMSYFRASIDAIFKNWPALQLLVTNQAAGPQSAEIAEWMITATEQWFSENQNLSTSEVSSYLEDIIVNEFNVEIQDDSYDEIGQLLCKMASVCASQDEARIVAELQKLPKYDMAKCRIQQDEDGESDSGDEDESMDCDDVSEMSNRNQKPQPDEDGWVTVPSRRKK